MQQYLRINGDAYAADDKYRHRVHHQIEQQGYRRNCGGDAPAHHNEQRRRLSAGCRGGDGGKIYVGRRVKDCAACGTGTFKETAGALKAEPLKIDKAEGTQKSRRYPQRIGLGKKVHKAAPGKALRGGGDYKHRSDGDGYEQQEPKQIFE